MADFVSHRLVDTETGNEVKKGEAGELWVSGPGVGRGYTKNPAKTAEAFVTHQGTPYYRTGDLARELHDGVMEILGRCDFMVKVRGYSVVLGAVEAAIKKLVGVAQVCVVAQGEEGTDKRIAAYFCESGPAELRGRMPVSTAAIDDYGRSPVLFQELLKELPHYAVPSVFIKIKTMPLNKASTKTDRFALPPLPAQPPSAAIAADFSYDGSEAASRLVFEEVLKLPEGTLTTESNFFEFGGHSLLVTHLLSRVHALGGPRVPVADFIRAPTVAGLSRLARGEASPTEPARFLPSEVEKHSGGMTGVSLAVKAYWNFIVFSNSSQRVLLTGATGYVGAHILNKLMRSSQSQVFCLVRGPRDYKGNETDREVARSRLIAHLGAHGLSSELDMDRLQVVVGDVGLPHLGMDTDDYRYLQQMVDVVIHTAANVNLAYNYDVLESINTQGTANAIDFARGGKVKALHYVSTNGIFPESGPAASFAETDIPPHHLLQTGYGQTKWVAERLVAKAAQLGLPTVTYRLGNVAGPSQGMGWNDKDSNLLFMRACLDNGAVPGGDWSIELTPVDFIAQFIVNCMMDIKFANNKTFHLINSSKLPLNLLARVAAGKGFPITRPTPSSWCGELSDSEGLLSVVLGDEALESLLGRHHTYLQSNIEAACAHFGMSYPRASEELLSGYVDRLVAENLLPGPPNAGGLRLGGRVAVVTGASTGIGLGVARALVAEGATVVLVDGSAENLKAISGQLGGTTYFPCDVTSRKSVHSTITDVQNSLGRIDILVNCAGAIHQTTTESRLYDDEWEDMVDMNCKGVMNVCGATFPMMLKAKKGHIVNISSDSGKTLPALTVYNASKAFVSAFSKGLRAESAGSGLRITDVQSGPANQSDSAGACLEPEDVASAVIYAVTSPSHMGLHEMLIEAR
ncbi:unnamed protein product [Polarella glacialis]|uniref:Carrier domain-containing protein n=1 Tax=Polarella glacialis TaxID=89957 RepID=A0A813E388_POLGL|nr:unnamed protein product [Polarella glacialis]